MTSMVLLFGKCSLDIARRELRRDGTLVAIEPQVLDLLAYFIRHRERVVSKDEIVDAVWSGRIVSNATLSSRICFVRRAIGDSGKGQRLVRTYPRRGFRFVGELCEGAAVASAPAAADERRSAPTRANSRARSEPAPRETTAVAVLPFMNLTPASAHDSFVDGVVEDIAGALSQFRCLSVIARGSTAACTGSATDVKRVGRELGVPYVLQGTVRLADGRARIAVQLVDAASGAYLWARRFDERLDCILDVQDEIAASVAGAIGPELEQIEIGRAKRARPESAGAYHHYLRGMGSVYRWTRTGVNEALAHFRRAAEIAPDFAAAYGMAAYCYVQRQSYGWAAERARETVECAALAQQALACGHDDATALARAAHAIAAVTQDLDAGAALADRALDLNHNDATGWYVSGWTRLFLGAVDAAAERLDRAMRLCLHGPLVFKTQAALAYAHLLSRRYDDASLAAQKALAARPNYLTALRAAAASHALAGRHDKARRSIAQMRKFDRKLRLSHLPDLLPFRRADHFGLWSDALRKAGLPE